LLRCLFLLLLFSCAELRELREDFRDDHACGTGMVHFVGTVRVLTKLAKTAPVTTVMVVRRILGEDPDLTPDDVVSICLPKDEKKAGD